jgi:hypothetical protein
MVLNQTKNAVNFRNFKKKDLNDRAMKVNFQHEGSIDDGGPLRETFDFMCLELQSTVLPILIPTENRRNDHGDLRDCFLVNPKCAKTWPYVKQELEMLYFFGVLIGNGILSTNPLPLNLHPIFWK